MKLNSATRIALWAVVATVIITGYALIRHSLREETTAASTVVKMRTVAGAPAPVAEPVSTTQLQTLEADSDATPPALAYKPVPPPSLILEGDSDASAFASVAESEAV